MKKTLKRWIGGLLFLSVFALLFSGQKVKAAEKEYQVYGTYTGLVGVRQAPQKVGSYILDAENAYCLQVKKSGKTLLDVKLASLTVLYNQDQIYYIERDQDRAILKTFSFKTRKSQKLAVIGGKENHYNLAGKSGSKIYYRESSGGKTDLKYYDRAQKKEVTVIKNAFAQGVSGKYLYAAQMEQGRFYQIDMNSGRKKLLVKKNFQMATIHNKKVYVSISKKKELGPQADNKDILRYYNTKYVNTVQRLEKNKKLKKISSVKGHEILYSSDQAVIYYNGDYKIREENGHERLQQDLLYYLYLPKLKKIVKLPGDVYQYLEKGDKLYLVLRKYDKDWSMTETLYRISLKKGTMKTVKKLKNTCILFTPDQKKAFYSSGEKIKYISLK